MAYVTAGTFYEDEILKMELIILKVKSAQYEDVGFIGLY